MAACSQARFAPANVFAHVRARLTLMPPPQGWRGMRGNDPTSCGSGLRPAAVLIGLAAYPREVRVILTRRNAALRVHSGQIAFPGGKIEAQDASPAAAALREAEEEIGLDAGRIEPLGYLDPYPTGSGFCIVPVVAKVAAPFALKINPAEVDETFEVPFAFLMDSANHELHRIERDGKIRHFHAMPYGTLNIWGVLRAYYAVSTRGFIADVARNSRTRFTLLFALHCLCAVSHFAPKLSFRNGALGQNGRLGVDLGGTCNGRGRHAHLRHSGSAP
jgi:8-oxo-dGTP pyrophosphatase MutT (NUDIX family)